MSQLFSRRGNERRRLSSEANRPHTVPEISSLSSHSGKSPWFQELKGIETKTAEILAKFGTRSKHSIILERKTEIIRKKDKPLNILIEKTQKDIHEGLAKSPSRKYVKSNSIRPKTSISLRNQTSSNHLGALKLVEQQTRGKFNLRCIATSHEKTKILDDHCNGVDCQPREGKCYDGENTDSSNELLRRNQAAIQIQRIARGGAKRRRLKIKEFLSTTGKGHDNVWIIVQDSAKNEVWYFNKLTGESSWEKPIHMDDVYQRSTSPMLPSLCSNSLHSSSLENRSQRKETKSQALPSLSLDSPGCSGNTRSRHSCIEVENEVKDPVDEQYFCQNDEDTSCQKPTYDLDNGSINFDEERKRIFSADGRPNSELRKAVFATLKHSSSANEISKHHQIRRENVKTKKHHTKQEYQPIFQNKDDVQMVSTLTIEEDKKGKQNQAFSSIPREINLMPSCSGESIGRHYKSCRRTIKNQQNSEVTSSIQTKSKNKKSNTLIQNITCLNCWSVGPGKKCFVHSKDHERQNSTDVGSILMCKNWDLGILQRRYRSEDIQEIFMKRFSAVQYDRDHKEFNLKVELKHPIYKLLSGEMRKYNFRHRCKLRLKLWFRSLVDSVRSGRIHGEKASDQRHLIRKKNSLRNQEKNYKLTCKMLSTHPKPPLTGSSFMERKGAVQIIFDNTIVIEGKSVKRKYIIDGPSPSPQALYQPRKYERCQPKTILWKDCEALPSYEKKSKFSTLSLSSKEKELIYGSQKYRLPPPTTKRFATFARKQTPRNLGVGGLNAELIISQFVSTYLPPRYGKFSVQNRTAMSPQISPEVTTYFVSLNVEPINQKYVERPLQHPLNHRKAPSITIAVGLGPTDKHAFGLNRVHQTKENEDFGFRTSDWIASPTLKADIITKTFVPAHDIATLNLPKENKPVTTRANSNYPFREPTAYMSTTMDFSELLKSYEACSPNRFQIFTSFGIQKPGQFMRGCDPNLPFGQFASKIIRNWAYKQTSYTEEFMNDNGISYWYNHRTGETFWERPILEEEKVPVKEGGVLSHDNENSITQHEKKSDPRYELMNTRKIILRRYETEEAKKIREKIGRKQCVDERVTPIDTFNKKSSDESSRKIERELFSGNIADLQNDDSSDTEARNKSDTTPISCEASICYNSVRDIGDGCDISDHDCDSMIDTQDRDSNQVIEKMSQERYQFESTETDETRIIEPIDSEEFQNGNLVRSIVDAVGGVLENIKSPRDMLKFGMGIGMSLGAQGLLKFEPNRNNSDSSSRASSDHRKTQTKTNVKKEEIQSDNLSGATYSNERADQSVKNHAIGSVNPTRTTDETSRLDHADEIEQERKKILKSNKFEDIDKSKGIVLIEPDITSDETKHTTDGTQNASVRDLEKKSGNTGPLHSNYETHSGAGLGTTFVRSSEATHHNKIIRNGGEVELRKSSKPIPVGFLSAISSKNVCKQYVDYLPTLANLPQCKPIGRVKPRSAGDDWLAVGFDPWSAGKDPLSSEFVSTMLAKAETFQEGKKSTTNTSEPFIDLIDRVGTSEQNRKTNEENVLEQEFREMCSYVRHGKYRELEDRMNEPDWNLPIDYVDVGGNTLLLISCQNGNKRIAKLCLRKGSNINKQNLNGQTCLHYAFGYGFDDLGEYLITKGADDSIVNVDGLTCYEGLSMEEVDAI